jgi:glycosyltransferase involved in cell wall biosynthesis
VGPTVPRVTIAVPIHNAAPFLETTLDSVLAQTYQDWEAILVDDASNDGSDEIAARYAQRDLQRFRLIRLRRNVGVVNARNLAIDAASDGELAVLLDHDDWLRVDYLERMVGLYDKERAMGRRIGIVGCDARLYGPDGFAPDTWGERLGWYDQVGLDTLIRQNTIFARALFSRRAFAEVGGLYPPCAGSDDFDLWARMLEAGHEVAVTREPLAVYRVHPGGLSRNRVIMTEAKLVAYRRMLDRGTLSHGQRRAVKRRMRHFRALRARARCQLARERGRLLQALWLGVAAAPQAAVAVMQDPGLLRRRRRQSAGGLSEVAA